MHVPDRLPEPADPQAPAFVLAHQAMLGHVLYETIALRGRVDEPHIPYDTQFLEELAQLDSRYEHWPATFRRGIRVASATRLLYGDRWRISVSMLRPRVNPALSADERDAVGGLAQAIVFTQVPLSPTGNTETPYGPTREALHEHWTRVHQELHGDPRDLGSLPHATWGSTIQAMLDGQVRIGPPPDDAMIQ